MPKTSLFETELYVHRKYLKTLGDFFDEKKLIQPGMSLTMNYTHTKDYQSQQATTTVTVVSVERVHELCCCNCCTCSSSDDDDDDISCYRIIGCVLKTEEPIFTCLYFADLARPFTLLNDTTTIASGSVHKILDKLEYVPKMVDNHTF